MVENCCAFRCEPLCPETRIRPEPELLWRDVKRNATEARLSGVGPNLYLIMLNLFGRYQPRRSVYDTNFIDVLLFHLSEVQYSRD